MCVTHRPAGDQDFAEIGFVVAICVFQIDRFRSILNDGTATVKRNRGRDTQLFCEDREFVGDPIAVGVFQNTDAVTTLAPWLQFVRIVERFADPETTSFVPVHRNRFPFEILFGGEQFHFEPDRRDEMFHRFFGRRGKLHLPFSVFDCAPLFSGRIERNVRFDVLEWFQIGSQLGHRRLIGERRNGAWILSASPADPSFDQIVKTGIGKRTSVVTPGGIEDSAFSMSPDPCPRLFGLPFRTSFKNRSIQRIMFRMNVGLVPTLEPLESLHHRVIRFSDRRAERSCSVFHKLGANQTDNGLVISKAKAGTVQRNESFSTGNVVEQRFGLIICDRINVCVNDQTVIPGQRGWVEIRRLIRIDQIDLLLRQSRLKLFESNGRLVMPVIAQIQKFQTTLFSR